MSALPDAIQSLEHRVIVSCQASEGDAFRDSASMARFAQAALAGGASGIRANGVEDIRAIRAAVPLPVIGIEKQVQEDARILITPSFESARAIVEAGAAIVALDCTARGCRYGALERLARIRTELRVPVMADIATLDEARGAVQAGATLVACTMRGYTSDTAHVKRFEPEFVAALARTAGVPVIAEGRIWTPEEAEAAITAGAYAVIIGTAITRPHDITARFAAAVEHAAARHRGTGYFLAIDLGGTNTKYGVVSTAGELVASCVEPTPAHAGRSVLLEHLKRISGRAAALAGAAGVTARALGVATAGWVNAETGTVAYATENLPGWTGTEIARELETAAGLPVAVENDANALAVAEKWFGSAREVRDFICITLGTGVGGGCYIAGKLNRGAHYFANALGHITIEVNGLPCTCGRSGCLEVYANAAALVRYAGGRFASAEEVIQAAAAQDAGAREANRVLARYLAVGAANIVNLLDPQLIVVAGGLVQNNPDLIAALAEELKRNVPAWEQRGLEIRGSELGYHAGVLGAAAVAMEKSAKN